MVLKLFFVRVAVTVFAVAFVLNETASANVPLPPLPHPLELIVALFAERVALVSQVPLMMSDVSNDVVPAVL